MDLIIIDFVRGEWGQIDTQLFVRIVQLTSSRRNVTMVVITGKPMAYYIAIAVDQKKQVYMI